MIDVVDPLAVGDGGRFVEVLYVLTHVRQFGSKNGFSGKLFTDLPKDPRVPDAVTPDHETGSFRLFEDPLPFAD